ncbi:hypothetical protein [Spirosoma validum]|uniref:Uncharacterized protein n=1 Tax=Spirosoma validum TaxID=2771355 RepID=A0A927GGD0_9BACT|nr:hypothetical protein [Spirosoma validum]MBD2756475.1 hypothetical protein [Spirosoma validum]
MNNNGNSKRRGNKLVNWITVWGLIFGCIAFNLYFDNRQTRLEKKYYRTQFEVESQRADSLHRAALQLEHRLRQIESGTTEKVSVSQPTTSAKSLVTSEL